ncbi:MAG: hypothetical protein QXI54_08370 [Archaeoglobaceae archaeon]
MRNTLIDLGLGKKVSEYDCYICNGLGDCKYRIEFRYSIYCVKDAEKIDDRLIL